MNKIKLYSRIVLIFTVPIAMSLITDYIRPVLGDWKCQGSGSPVTVDRDTYSYTDHWAGCNYNPGPFQEEFHHSTWHYGFGHYVFIAMGLTLFIVQIVFLVNEFNKVKK